MNKKEKRGRKIVISVIILIVVLLMGGVLLAGGMSGWFDDSKITLDNEYYGEGAEFIGLSAGEYENLIKDKKTFLVFVDQGGCTTADRLRGYMKDYMKEKGILAYRIMFSDLKESSLHNKVKYYPSVAVVSKGKVVGFLRADVDEDAEMYNDYEAFKGWIGKWL